MKKVIVLAFLSLTLGGCLVPFTAMESFLGGNMLGMLLNAYGKPALDKATTSNPPATKEEIKKMIEDALVQRAQINPSSAVLPSGTPTPVKP